MKVRSGSVEVVKNLNFTSMNKLETIIHDFSILSF